MYRSLLTGLLAAAVLLLVHVDTEQPNVLGSSFFDGTTPVERWWNLPVGAKASYERGRAMNLDGKSAPSQYTGVYEALLATPTLQPAERVALLHTAKLEEGTASEYLFLGQRRASNDPMWLAELHSLRETMQRSTQYDGPGVWVGVDPMAMRCTVKLEIAKVINVLD